MTDLISRQAAIEDIRTMIPKDARFDIKWIEMWLMQLPSAEPVRHGKWIREVRYTIDSLHSYQQYRCSECGMTYITNTKHCPNCGARMDEE